MKIHRRMGGLFSIWNLLASINNLFFPVLCGSRGTTCSYARQMRLLSRYGFYTGYNGWVGFKEVEYSEWYLELPLEVEAGGSGAG